MAIAGFGFQNPVSVQDNLVNQFVTSSLGLPSAPVAPTFASSVPLDAQLSLSLQARTLTGTAPEQPVTHQHHGHHHHQFSHHQHGAGQVSQEGVSFLQRRGLGFR